MLTRLALLDRLPTGSVGAELGVFEGAFSAEILARVQPRCLYLVDLFSGYVFSGDQDGRHVHGADMANQYWALTERWASKAEVSLVREHSVAWLAAQPAASLDWVYIDTDHTYHTTVRELAAARRAVRPGGSICGHDYSPQFPGVLAAVHGFVLAHSLPLVIYGADVLPSYQIINCPPCEP